MLSSIDFYLFFILFTIGPASQFVLANNLGSILNSLSYDTLKPNNFVIILSITNFVGTIIGGTLSDTLARVFHRPVFYVFAIGLIGVSISLLSIATLHFWWYPLVSLFGIGIGIMWAMAPSICHELWGNKHWGFNYGLLNLGPAIGSYLFATLLTSKIYEKHTPAGQNKCYGPTCYQDTFIIMGGFGGFAVILGVILSIRTRLLYRRKLLLKEIVSRFE